MNIKHLKLVSHFAAQSDTRYYLNGVMVETGRLVASDGHRLCEIQCDTSLSERIIIPFGDVKAFLSRFGKKEQDFTFEIVKIGERWQLQCAGIVQVFAPIDGSYPDIDRIIERDMVRKPLEYRFDWQYLAGAERALREFHANKYFHMSIYSPLKPGIRQGIVVDEMGGYHITIMPRRD